LPSVDCPGIFVGEQGYSGDGGEATVATLSAPKGVTADPNTGNVIIADSGNNATRIVTFNAKSIGGSIADLAVDFSQPGTITTLVGGAATPLQLNNPGGVYVDDATSQVRTRSRTVIFLPAAWKDE
jgi:hypothetical protein